MIRSKRPPLSADGRRVVAAQALRAFAYGFGALLLGTTLKARGLSSAEIGVVLACLVAGTIVMSVAVVAWSDRVGRKRFYVALYVALAASGAVYAVADSVVVLGLVALAGVVSTDIVDNGPFTSLEQAMLSADLARREQIRGFGLYNAVAAVAGSLGALAAQVPADARHLWQWAPSDQRYFLLFVPVAAVGALVAATLSPSIEAPPRPAGHRRSQLGPSKPTVLRLAGLFSVDAFGGGFVIQSFIAYWLATKFHTSLSTLGVVFFAVGLLQTVSFFAATRLAERFGLLPTMVFSHLPSNLLLAGVAFAPNVTVAVGMLLTRSLLSQMDVPTRQAYVMALVTAEERTAAAGYTNTARYVVRPLGPILAGVGQSLFMGLPFVTAGAVKSIYDLVLWRWFRTVPLPPEAEAAVLEPAPTATEATTTASDRSPA